MSRDLAKLAEAIAVDTRRSVQVERMWQEKLEEEQWQKQQKEEPLDQVS